MEFTQKNGCLIGRHEHETLCIEAWGKNALRVRSTANRAFSGRCNALDPEKRSADAQIRLSPDGAEIRSGSLRAVLNSTGVISFFKEDTLLLREYYRNYGGTICKEGRALKLEGRELKPLAGNDYTIKARFESRDGEKLFGMGQYQQPYLDLKGCTLELAQRNSQSSIPFVLSNLGYGLLWNNPAVGTVSFGKNLTEWTATEAEELDYWITTDEAPAKIIENYTDVVGRSPMFPEKILGLWQCKLRYRSQEEVLAVARKYRELGIPLDVIVIDFFHWPYQGSWCFDKKYWPDVRAMTDELHAMGIKVMVSVWPSVDKRGKNFGELQERGLLLRTERGTVETYDFQGECATIDLFNPEARQFLYETCKKNYSDLGIDFFWLDNAEPDLAVYDFDNIRCYDGPMQKYGAAYPKDYAKTFHDGMTADGRTPFMNLIRCGWVGSQKYSTLLWSGDIPSTYEALRDQISAGLNIGIAGIPWWTTDIGGFMTDDVNDPDFRELLVRWYEFAVFCPILRMHGDRGPYNIPELDHRDYGGGYLHTGQPNELWSYGEDVFRILKANLDTRLTLKPYLMDLMQQAHETGAPLMRTMFFEFPQDAACWNLDDQYMFGSRYLVAPILTPKTFERKVYLPAGNWQEIHSGEQFAGGESVTVKAPLEYIPVFERLTK
ncbi:MAG: family 31 glucosidase [Oscillospiraceae bacterium]|nr:family 31 glucosidase [Oscillospiraceae bacterium]MDD3260953.1 glycoside hydrolase family 31 protein [Oscillospiraceae bacterium]